MGKEYIRDTIALGVVPSWDKILFFDDFSSSRFLEDYTDITDPLVIRTPMYRLTGEASLLFHNDTDPPVDAAEKTFRWFGRAPSSHIITANTVFYPAVADSLEYVYFNCAINTGSRVVTGGIRVKISDGEISILTTSSAWSAVTGATTKLSDTNWNVISFSFNWSTEEYIAATVNGIERDISAETINAANSTSAPATIPKIGAIQEGAGEGFYIWLDQVLVIND